MKIKDRPEFRSKATVLTFAPGDRVADAVAVMSERNYGSVVIVDPERKPIGIVTERDLMRRLLHRRLDIETTTLDQIMTTDLKVARADDDLLDWLRLMSNERFRHLPVVNDQGVLISMMSQGDFVSYTWPELLGRLREQAKATFDVSPSLVMMVAGGVLFAVATLILFLQAR
ncbi:MAG: signal transduction protein [Alphaproteobacteria bacterium]|nr:MAG: signal transduction protein [Alphaproteobacteria bacterium]PZO35110.1 MAG: signal transduction protein [Alphaproteobacteria bacterium]